MAYYTSERVVESPGGSSSALVDHIPNLYTVYLLTTASVVWALCLPYHLFVLKKSSVKTPPRVKRMASDLCIVLAVFDPPRRKREQSREYYKKIIVQMCTFDHFKSSCSYAGREEFSLV